MAETRFARGDALTVEHWSRLLAYDIVYRSPIGPMIGKSEDSIIHLKDDISKDKGDKVTFGLLAKLTGEGFTENEIAQGNGEALSLFSDAITVNELGHVVDIPNPGRSIDSARVRVPLRAAARRGLRTWWQERLAVSFFNQVCSNTVQSDTKFTGMNAVTDATRVVRLNTDSSFATVANDESLASGDDFTLTHIDIAVEQARAPSSGVPLRPTNIVPGEGGSDLDDDKYVMYIHPYQKTQLRRSTDTGQWLDIQKSAMQGGQVSRNPIFTGALGMYNNVILKESNQIPTGVNSSDGTAVSNVRRAVLLGAQSCAAAFSANGGANAMGWNEELFDHKRRMEVSTLRIWGMKKCRFTRDGSAQDLSAIVVPTFSAASA